MSWATSIACFRIVPAALWLVNETSGLARGSRHAIIVGRLDERRLGAVSSDYADVDLSIAGSIDKNGLPMRRLQAILTGTLIVGTLDLLDAMIYFGIRNGATPVRIGQSIAAGWIGRDAFRGGFPAAMLGFATHYFIAFAIVTVYLMASRRLEILVRRPWLCGALYGIGVYFFMNRVVIPLSAIGGPQPFVLGPVVNGLFIHVFGIGIPSALVAAATERGATARVTAPD
jgi:hypothetical protein